MADQKRDTSDQIEQSHLSSMKKHLDSISPSFCLAKWLHVSLHLTTGKTSSCYHPVAHSIDKQEIKKNPSALHNTAQKRRERAQMMEGKKPPGCSYCWRIEESGNHFSDRHYRSSEHWAKDRFQEVVRGGSNYDVTPSYVEINFSNVCQFKCSYCYPHVSTAWLEESRKHGPWPTIKPVHDVENLEKTGLFQGAPSKNPYLEAFWKWWPELYPKLKVFRMTGGEPLIDHNTYRILDYISRYPHPSLELAITSNLCPPKKTMIRFQKKIEALLQNQKISRFILFPSIDTWGRQAEYIRFGLNISEFEKNVKALAKELPKILISFIITNNALSPFGLKNLLEKILEWQEESFHIHKSRSRQMFVDLPYLRFPPWQALNILPASLAGRHFKDSLDFMEANRINPKKGKFYGFSESEISKLKRLMDVIKLPVDRKKQRENRINFYKFFSEHDRRRNTDFLQTFPELGEFWRDCRRLAEEWETDQKAPRKCADLI